jgi:hypothetical protein
MDAGAEGEMGALQLNESRGEENPAENPSTENPSTGGGRENPHDSFAPRPGETDEDFFARKDEEARVEFAAAVQAWREDRAKGVCVGVCACVSVCVYQSRTSAPSVNADESSSLILCACMLYTYACMHACACIHKQTFNYARVCVRVCMNIFISYIYIYHMINILPRILIFTTNIDIHYYQQ